MKQSLENSPLAKLFGSISRVRILAILFRRPYQPLYQREVMYETSLSLQTVQRELRNLIELGILKRHSTNQKVYYQISSTSSFFKPLKEIFGSGL